MPNALPEAAGGRPLLVKPGRSLDKPLLGLGGQAQAFRHKQVSQEVEPAVDSTNERLVGVFLHFQVVKKRVHLLNDAP